MNRDVQDFYELRTGFQGMADFSTAALRFLDKFGIAPLRAAARAAASNGHGGLTAEALREKVKRHYKKRRPQVPYLQKRAQQRAISAALLDALDTVEPRPLIAEGRRHISALVRRGYARKKGGKGLYVRTAKLYNVTDKPSVADASAADDTGFLRVSEVAKRLKVSETHVRSLLKKKKLRGRLERHVPKGRTVPKPMWVVDPDEITRFLASENA